MLKLNQFFKLCIHLLILSWKLCISSPTLLKSCLVFQCCNTNLLPDPSINPESWRCPGNSAKDRKYLQMFCTWMINMVTTPAPVLRKFPANQSVSFPKQPYRNIMQTIINKRELALLQTCCTHDHLLPDVVEDVRDVAGVLLATWYWGVILPVFRPMNTTTLKLLKKIISE